MTGLLLNCIIFTIMILGILMVLHDSRESFVDAGLYPKSVTKPILTNSYPLKTPGGLSSWNYSSQWRLYPIWSVGSYTQKTNNIKYWPQPCNGTAAPADVCGGLYKEKKVPPSCIPAPPQRNCRRVNYYCSI